MISPLTPFVRWGWEPPYRTEHPEFTVTARVIPVRHAPGIVTSSRGGMAHIANGVASVRIGKRVQYGARWLCKSGTEHATLLDSADAYGGICDRCEDVRLGPGVYHCFGTSGRLLYIGSSGRCAQRFQTHESQTPWWPEVASVRVQRFASLPEARAAERIAIFAERPPYNVLPRPPCSSVLIAEDGAA